MPPTPPRPPPKPPMPPLMPPLRPPYLSFFKRSFFNSFWRPNPPPSPPKPSPPPSPPLSPPPSPHPYPPSPPKPPLKSCMRCSTTRSAATNVILLYFINSCNDNLQCSASHCTVLLCWWSQFDSSFDRSVHNSGDTKLISVSFSTTVFVYCWHINTEIPKYTASVSVENRQATRTVIITTFMIQFRGTFCV